MTNNRRSYRNENYYDYNHYLADINMLFNFMCVQSGGNGR